MSLGLENAGFEVVAACEKDNWACDTYETNHPDVNLFRSDIKELSNNLLLELRGKIDVVAGGPPCQGFSISGKRQYGIDNPQNKLVYEYIRVVKQIRPKIFILENVRGFTSGTIEGRKKALDVILKQLSEEGYHLYHKVLQAADYGIPSYRSRLFVVGSLTKMKGDPFPDITHSHPDELAFKTKPYLSVKEAISDLPDIEAREGKDGLQLYEQKPTNIFQKSMRLNCKGVYNHEAMKHSPRLIERFEQIPQGGKGYDFGRKSNNTSASVTVYKSNNQRLVADLPSLCITANFQSNYIHPYKNRNLTAREAARLMTFPDWYIFKGKRTLMSSSLLDSEGRQAENYLSQYNQIGNSVPPLLAEQIGKAILSVIQTQVERKNERSSSRVLST